MLNTVELLALLIGDFNLWVFTLSGSSVFPPCEIELADNIEIVIIKFLYEFCVYVLQLFICVFVGFRFLDDLLKDFFSALLFVLVNLAISTKVHRVNHFLV